MPNQYSAKNELLDARAALKLLEDEAAELRGKLHAAALDGNREEYSRLQMAETSLPLRRSEAERRLLPLEIAYAEKQEEAAFAKRAAAGDDILAASERQQAAERETRLAQGARETAQTELDAARRKIRAITEQSGRLGLSTELELEVTT